MLYSPRSISPSGALALEKKALENGLHSNQGPTLSPFYVVNKNIHNAFYISTVHISIDFLLYFLKILIRLDF